MVASTFFVNVWIGPTRFNASVEVKSSPSSTISVPALMVATRSVDVFSMAEVSPPVYAVMSSPRAMVLLFISAMLLWIAAASRSTSVRSRMTCVGVARADVISPRPARRNVG